MPRITKARCAENPEQYHELAGPPECCSTCLETFEMEKSMDSLAQGGGKGRVTSPQERWRRKRNSQEAWKQRHRETYLAQKRELAHRPEYLAQRRQLYAQRRAAAKALCEVPSADEGA